MYEPPFRDPPADLRPTVASETSSTGLWVAAGGVALAGVVVLLALMQHRAEVAATRGGRPSSPQSEKTAAISAPPAPADFGAVEAVARGQGPAKPPPTDPPPIAPQAPPPVAPIADVAVSAERAQRLKSPSVIIDLGAGAAPAAQSASTSASAVGPATALAGGAPTGGRADPKMDALTGDERFAERVGSGEPDRARATRLHNTPTLAPQGTIIAAILETALNSDLPGFARAVVGRDVLGFDGSTVVIPRGSRLIGQYKSAVSQGQTRAFVIWTRVIRPDGVSIQIGSPGGDALGRAGLDGTVDRHFFERFSGSVLLSVVNAGVASLANRAGTQIVIGTAQEAAGAATAIAAPTPIPPTIRVPQGTPIRVFVARDLDFSPVQGPDREPGR